MFGRIYSVPKGRPGMLPVSQNVSSPLVLRPAVIAKTMPKTKKIMVKSRAKIPQINRQHLPSLHLDPQIAPKIPMTKAITAKRKVIATGI